MILYPAIDLKGGRCVRLHSRVSKVVHQRHQSRQDARVLLLLQLGAQVRAHLAQRLAGRPPHLGVLVLQPLQPRNQTPSGMCHTVVGFPFLTQPECYSSPYSPSLQSEAYIFFIFPLRFCFFLDL